VLNQQQAFQHMAAWAIQNLFNVYKEAQEVLADEKLTDTEKALKIKGPHGTDHRMLNLMLLLKPAVEQAELEFPDHIATFFKWFHNRWEFVQGLNIIEGVCKCKGCKPAEDDVS
jgi:hypothetical protein